MDEELMGDERWTMSGWRKWVEEEWVEEEWVEEELMDDE